MKLLLAVLALPTLVCGARPLLLAEEFSLWKQTHAKEYPSATEEERRFAVWQANREYVNAHNEKEARGLSTFKMALNHLGDLSNAEYRAQMLGLKAAYRPSAAAISPPREPPRSSGPPPDSWDWRPRGVVTAVKNQEACGSW